MVETERLIIRNASFADLDKFAEWESDPDVIQYFTIKGVRDLDVITDEFHHTIYSTSRKWLTIIYKETMQPIGKVLLEDIDHLNDSLDIGKLYIGDSSMRGKGLGAEAFEGVLQYTFEQIGMHRVSLNYFLDDKVLAGLADKLSFHKEGIMIGAGKHNDKYVDLMLCAITREEWEEQQEIKALEAKQAGEA